MVTVQDIREKTFERAGKGYNMSQVDEFLDELAADFSTLSKENASLKNKMRMLVQKVDEYRQTEDSMRLALMSAQKLSAQIESEAKERADTTIADAQERASTALAEAQRQADTTIADAQSYANRVTKQVNDSIANEQAKLEEARKATVKFFDHMKAVCQKQLEFYDKLDQMQLVGDAQEPAKTVQSAPTPAPAPAPTPAPVRTEKPAKPSREEEMEEAVRSIEQSAKTAALEEPEDVEEDIEDIDVDLEVDTDLPEEEEEPTRLYPAGNQPPKKRRSFDDFSFDDDI